MFGAERALVDLNRLLVQRRRRRPAGLVVEVRKVDHSGDGLVMFFARDAAPPSAETSYGSACMYFPCLL